MNAIDAITEIKCSSSSFLYHASLMSEIHIFYISEGMLVIQAGRRLVRSLLTVCDIGVSSHPWVYVDNK